MKKALYIIIPLFIIAISSFFIFNNNNISNTKWKLTGWSINSISTDVSNITLEINDDNTISGNGGVNNYSASYTIGFGNKFSIGDIKSTLIASEDPNEAETIYFTLLKEVRYYELKDNELILLDSNKNQILIFNKQ